MSKHWHINLDEQRSVSGEHHEGDTYRFKLQHGNVISYLILSREAIYAMESIIHTIDAEEKGEI
jgi:hypothetical protein